jgi:hypothetical protein
MCMTTDQAWELSYFHTITPDSGGVEEDLGRAMAASRSAVFASWALHATERIARLL